MSPHVPAAVNRNGRAMTAANAMMLFCATRMEHAVRFSRLALTYFSVEPYDQPFLAHVIPSTTVKHVIPTATL